MDAFVKVMMGMFERGGAWLDDDVVAVGPLGAKADAFYEDNNLPAYGAKGMYNAGKCSL